MIKLEHIAARIAFDKVDADEIQSIVDALLMDGVYSDEFIVIMDAKPPTRADVLPPFKAYLEAEGISVPTKDQAVWQLIAHHVLRITSEAVAPLAGLQDLISEVYHDYDFYTSTRKYIGDSHGIEHLIGLYWEHSDMLETLRGVSRKDAKEFDELIVQRSREWMERFGDRTFEAMP